ncbi:NADPH:quinone reductase [Nitzschia inconspicua]|uniref:NADPH:quinone reductase n=1 Tax=Nitzschia inconspicua TaxID=303405 RepID=A0A9K3Q1U4_9STRA|nr:NADPH:quinone reductase [Nitzschia inconspicua]
MFAKRLIVPSSHAQKPTCISSRSILRLALLGISVLPSSDSIFVPRRQFFQKALSMTSNRGIYFGGYQQPVHEQVLEKRSKADRNHVVVQVYAVSINPVDAKGVIGDKLATHWTRARRFAHNCMIKNTRVGFDFAGKVVESPYGHSQAEDLSEGTIVYGTMPPLQGSFAEYIRVPCHQLAKAPCSASIEEIACLPLVGLTAWQALSPCIKPEQSNVLVVGGSGGTGHVAIQMAKALGAKTVTTICSTRNVDFVKKCGATDVIDYQTEDDVIAALQRRVDEPFDIIFDTITSGDPNDAIYNYPQRIQQATNPPILTPEYFYQRLGGKWTDWIRAGLARPGIFPHSWLWSDPRERLFWIKFPKSSVALQELTKIVDSGQLRVHVQKIYPEMTVDTVQQAMDDLLSRRVQGKIAIRVIPQQQQ